MLRFAPMFAALLIAAPALADAPMEGKWQCNYGVRKLSEAKEASAAWFEVTLAGSGRFHGGGKAIAAGLAMAMTLNGSWSVDEDGVLKMTGISDVTNQKLPFRFESDRVDDDTFKRHAVRKGTEYKTGCIRREE